MTPLTKDDLGTATGGQAVVGIYQAIHNRLNPTCDEAKRRLADVQAQGQKPGFSIPFFSAATQSLAEHIAQSKVTASCK